MALSVERDESLSPQALIGKSVAPLPPVKFHSPSPIKTHAPPSPTKLASNLRPPEDVRPTLCSHPPPPPVLPPPPVAPASWDFAVERPRLDMASEWEDVERSLCTLLSAKGNLAKRDMCNEAFVMSIGAKIQLQVQRLRQHQESDVETADVEGGRALSDRDLFSCEGANFKHCDESAHLQATLCAKIEACQRSAFELDAVRRELRECEVSATHRISAQEDGTDNDCTPGKGTDAECPISDAFRVHGGSSQKPGGPADCESRQKSIGTAGRHWSLHAARRYEASLRDRCRNLEAQCQDVRRKRAEFAGQLEDEQQALIAAQELHGRFLWATAGRRSLAEVTLRGVQELQQQLRKLEEEPREDASTVESSAQDEGSGGELECRSERTRRLLWPASPQSLLLAQGKEFEVSSQRSAEASGEPEPEAILAHEGSESSAIVDVGGAPQPESPLAPSWLRRSESLARRASTALRRRSVPARVSSSATSWSLSRSTSQGSLAPLALRSSASVQTLFTIPVVPLLRPSVSHSPPPSLVMTCNHRVLGHRVLVPVAAR